MKIIILTRSSETLYKKAEASFSDHTYGSDHFNANIFKRLLLDCLLSIDLDDGSTAEEVVEVFRQRYNLPIDDVLLSESVFQELEYDGAKDYICNDANLKELLLNWSKDTDKMIVAQPYHRLLINDGEDEIIIVDYQAIRDRFSAMTRNFIISNDLRLELILSVCKDCGVPEDGRNMLFIHDHEWGENLSATQCKEILCDGSGKLPNDLATLKDCFNYVGVFTHTSNMVYNKALSLIPE